MTALPLTQIADNVRALTGQLKQLSASPQLRDIATQIDATARAAEQTLGASPNAPSGNPQKPVNELGGAARAIRSLADYRDAHPESLLRGRGRQRRARRSGCR